MLPGGDQSWQQAHADYWNSSNGREYGGINELASLLQHSSLQSGTAVAHQPAAVLPLVTFEAPSMTDAPQPALPGMAACSGMMPMAMPAPDDELMLWDRRHPSAIPATAAMHAVASHSSGGSPRAPGTFYRNPFAIASPFKQLGLRPLSGQHQGFAGDLAAGAAGLTQPGEMEFVPDTMDAAEAASHMASSAWDGGRSSAATLGIPSAPQPEPLSPYRAALLADAAAETAAAAAAAAATLSAAPRYPNAATAKPLLRRAPLGDLTNRAHPTAKSGPGAKPATAVKPRPGRSSGGAASAPKAPAPAAELPPRQRFVPLGTMASRSAAPQQPSHTAAAAAPTEPSHRTLPLPPQQQPVSHGRSFLVTPPAGAPLPSLMAGMPPQMQPVSGGSGGNMHCSEAAAALQFHSQQRAVARYGFDASRYPFPGGQLLYQQPDSGGVSQYPFPGSQPQYEQPGRIDASQYPFPGGQPRYTLPDSNSSAAGGYGAQPGWRYAATTATAPDVPTGYAFSSSGGGGSSSWTPICNDSPAAGSQIAPQDASAWCYKLHVASSQGKKHVELGRGDVKTLVEHQLERGEPIRAPWYRHPRHSVPGNARAHAGRAKYPNRQVQQGDDHQMAGTGVFVPKSG